ncbi:hypothetical protein [Oceanicaulis alexandrii]|uniref:hypothetical protein n=1 Tax=Oceanicaulis alexandrii TaxID=153233 RepID=UPI0003B44478|nr:hypothetical protein [Oceanicaulis alexandrii]
MTLRVILQIYSGRRDPEWLVTGELETRLLEALEGLPPGPEWTPPTRLGYRGIRIEQDSPALHWLCVKGQVLRQEGAGTHWFKDADCTIEAMALESGRTFLDPTTLDHLIKMLTEAH